MKTHQEIMQRYNELGVEQAGITAKLKVISRIPFTDWQLAQLRELMRRDREICAEILSMNSSDEVQQAIASAA